MSIFSRVNVFSRSKSSTASSSPSSTSSHNQSLPSSPRLTSVPHPAFDPHPAQVSPSHSDSSILLSSPTHDTTTPPPDIARKIVSEHRDLLAPQSPNSLPYLTPPSRGSVQDNDPHYEYNSLNDFSFGQPQAAPMQYVPIDPLSPRTDGDDDYRYKSDTTPRPSIASQSAGPSHSAYPSHSIKAPDWSSPFTSPKSRRHRVHDSSSDAESYQTFGSTASHSVSDGASYNSRSTSRSSARTTSDLSSDHGDEHWHPVARRDGGATGYSTEEEFEDYHSDGIEVSSTANEGSDKGTIVDYRSIRSVNAISERKGSLSIPVPGPSEGRQREDSVVTVRRLSKSLEYLPSSLIPGAPNDATSLSLRNRPLPPAPPLSIPGNDLHEWSTQRDSSNPPSSSLPPAATSAVEAFSLDFSKYAQGINGFAQDEVSDLVTDFPGPRRNTLASINSRRRSSVSSGNTDSFHRKVNQWSDPDLPWRFKKDKADEPSSSEAYVRSKVSIIRERTSFSASSRPKGGPSDSIFSGGDSRAKERWAGMELNKEEFWRNPYCGSFRVNRKDNYAVPDGKPPQQRVSVCHYRDGYSAELDLCDGPETSIHKHSKARAFSISRRYRDARKVEGPRKNGSMLLLAPSSVQVKYTSTNTTRKLESHGLLSENGRLSAKDQQRLQQLDRHRKTQPEVLDTRVLSTTDSRSSSTSKTKPTPAPQPSETQHHTSSFGSSVGEGSAGSTLVSGSPPTNPNASRPSSSSGSVAPSTFSNETTSTASDRTITPYPQLFRLQPQQHETPEVDEEDDDDDDDLPRSERPPSRTPHGEAFSALTPEDVENGRKLARRKRFPTSSSILPSQKPIMPFVPVWPVSLPRAYHEHSSMVDGLNGSFQDVGLLPAVENTKNSHHHHGSSSKRSQKSTKKQTSSSALMEFEDAFYMLVPLWPSETDKKWATKVKFTVPDIPQTKRLYLLVYFTDESKQEVDKKKAESKKSPTSSRESSKSANGKDNPHVLLTRFHVSARVVSYKALQGSGVRIPDEGLSVLGSLEQAYKTMPKSTTDGFDMVIATCSSRDSGLQFDKHGLEALGLCCSDGPIDVSEDNEEFEPDLKPTPVGRAVLEIIWLGFLGLTSFRAQSQA